MKIKKLLILFSILSIYFFGIMKMQYYFNTFFGDTNIAKNSFNIFLISSILFTIVTFIILRKLDLNSISSYANKRSFKKIILMGILSSLILFIGDKLIDIILKFFNYLIVDDTIRIKNIISNNKMMFLYMVIILPTMEEFIYRNIIFGGLYDIYGGGKEYIRFLTPALITGFIFYNISGGFNLIFIKVMYSSLILSFSYYKTKRIETAILSSILYNLFIVLFAIFTKAPSVLELKF